MARWRGFLLSLNLLNLELEDVELAVVESLSDEEQI
jgi:hypothetical protein